MLKLWISLLEVEALPGSEHANWGKAFVNGLVLAADGKEAEKEFEFGLREIGFKLISSEDTEEFSKRISKFEVSEEVKELSKIAQRTRKVQFGTFHTWDKDRLRNRDKK